MYSEHTSSREIVHFTPNKIDDIHPYSIVAAGRSNVIPSDPLHNTSYHQHTLILTQSGCGRVLMKGKSFDATPGTLVWLNTSLEYGHCCQNRASHWRYLWIGVTGFGLDALFARICRKNDPVHLVTGGLDAAFERAIEALQTKEPWLGSTSTAICASIVEAILRGQYISEPNGEDKLADILIHIKSNLGDHWNVEAMAAKAHQSPSHFHKVFRKTYDMTPMGWLRTERINAAKYLLSRTQTRVSEIGRVCGYLDPYHFSREFSRKVGLSPKKFRKSILR